MKKNSIKFLIIFVFFVALIAGAQTSSETSTVGVLEGILVRILTKIKDILTTIGYIVTAIFIIIGGYQMLTAAGNPQQFETGKRTLVYAAIGFLVVLLADKLADMLKSLFTQW
jgi:TRAP-type C4-dicarboxylate transport system permease small subunit